MVNCQYRYEINDDSAHGIRLSGNEHFVIFALNRFRLYGIFPAPYDDSLECTVFYFDTALYVFSLATVSDYNNLNSTELYTFVQVAENMETSDVFFSVVQVNKSECGKLI